MSRAHFAIGPAESKSYEIGHIPSCGINPRVGFREYTSARVAGMSRDPFVSVPIATGAKPADTPTAEPEEDPPVLWTIPLVSDLTIWPGKEHVFDVHYGLQNHHPISFRL